MKRFMTILMMMLISFTLFGNETITVKANSEDIANGLDLKIVANIFAQSNNLEEFELLLNNPNTAFCNLDLNGDGQVDYLRVIESGEGNKRLILLQAVLAKDIFQDVASIYINKDKKEPVTIQIIGDEYIYGTNYIIEPVYIYQPVIYNWLWCSTWYRYYSPWYWGYYPRWWYTHRCRTYDQYWRHCYSYHQKHHWCSYHHGHKPHHGYQKLYSGVSRRDYAKQHPHHSFSQRHVNKTNARELTHINTTKAQTQQNRTYNSRNIVKQPTTNAQTRTVQRQQTNKAVQQRSTTTQTRQITNQRSSRSQSTYRGTQPQRSTQPVMRSSGHSSRQLSGSYRPSVNRTTTRSSAPVQRSSGARSRR